MLRPASDPGLLPGCCIGTVQIGSTINSILPAALTRLAMQAEFPGLSHSPLLCPGLSMAQLQSCSFTPRAAHCRALPAAQACLTPVPTPVTSPVLPGPLETTPALTSIGKLWENLGSSRATYLKKQQQQQKNHTHRKYNATATGSETRRDGPTNKRNQTPPLSLFFYYKDMTDYQQVFKIS